MGLCACQARTFLNFLNLFLHVLIENISMRACVHSLLPLLSVIPFQLSPFPESCSDFLWSWLPYPSQVASSLNSSPLLAAMLPGCSLYMAWQPCFLVAVCKQHGFPVLYFKDAHPQLEGPFSIQQGFCVSSPRLFSWRSIQTSSGVCS